MMALVSEVHLFICLDENVSPGVVLHCLDIARAQDWQQETILLCDISWKKFVNVDQPVIFIDREKIKSGATPNQQIEYLEALLEQLDSFEITQVTQIGDLSWGRWLTSYLEQVEDKQTRVIDWKSDQFTTLQVLNDLARELALDISAPSSPRTKSQAIYIDPYVGQKFSPRFIEIVENLKQQKVPEWINIICQKHDKAYLEEMGLGEFLIDWDETEMSLFNQAVLCFSDQSPLALTSRSYNVALFECEGDQSLFLPGDISIRTSQSIQAVEIFNILTYWKSRRLKELAFQWLNMGIDISCIEAFHARVIKRNLLNYSTDLYHSQLLIKEFMENPSHSHNYDIEKLIGYMRKNIDNDPYSLSFSLKILVMITQRMIAAAKGGERLFQRLGSDYHRIIIGESLVEGMIEKSSAQEIDVNKKLKEFLSYLVKIDHINDQTCQAASLKESP